MTRRSFLLDDALADYIAEHTPPPTEVEQALIDETADLAEWDMQISPEQAALLRLLVRLSGAKRILEIGTFTGYSALVMASAMPEDGTLLALDRSEEWTAVARRYWKEAGAEDRIELRLGEAGKLLAAMPKDPTFDFVFLDADKIGYPDYLALITPRMMPGGVLVADNTIRRGRVADPSNTEEGIEAVRRYNDAVRGDDWVEAQVLPLFDGVTVAVKR